MASLHTLSSLFKTNHYVGMVCFADRNFVKVKSVFLKVNN